MKRSITHYAITFGIRILVFIIAITTAQQLLKSDFQPFITWWLTLLAITVTFYPVIGLLFHRFHDGGWVFSKSIGLALSGYMMWFLSSLHILKFNHSNTIVTLGICFLINLGIVAYYNYNLPQEQKQNRTIFSLYQIDIEKVKSMITVEVMFFCIFFLWIYIRGFRPEVSNTESPMDYGFMAAMMRSNYLPAEDIWLSGKPINYYYVGQYMATFLTKLSNVKLELGYNFSLMTIAGIGFTLSYSLIYNVTQTFLRDITLPKRITSKPSLPLAAKKINRFWCTLAGLIASISVIFAGNMHYVIFYHIKPFIEKLFKMKISSYWWPDSTRYIGYNPVREHDKTIHEFPSYSFILGDLHAHVVNIIFVLSVLGLLFIYLLNRKDKMDDIRLGVGIKRPKFLREAFHPIILLLGFFIGLFHMSNYWDFPIYYVVCGAIILFSNAVLYQFSLDTLKLTAVHAVVIYVLAKIVALPFTLKFDQISSAICLTEYRTLPYQLLVLWGLPILIVAYYVIARYRDLKLEGYITKKGSEYYTKKKLKKKKIIKAEDLDTTVIAFSGEKNKLFQFIEHLQIADLFMVTVGLCAIGLIILPEVIYVEDIYSDYRRANTMFKLTYQGFIMFGLSMGYILVRGLAFTRKVLRRCAAIAGLLLLLWTMYYPVTAINMWLGNILKTENFKGLDSLKFMEARCNDDYMAINWLNDNVSGTKVIVEGYGGSYSNYDRISAFTGLPTIIGWQTHEYLWRSGALGGFPPIITERQEDVTTIYTSQDKNEILYYLKKYDVDYIYLGSMEAEQFGSVNNEVLKALGEIVFYSEPATGKDYETAIIKIDKSAYENVIQIDETLNDGLAKQI
jgi:YYY domain-containing protein